MALKHNTSTIPKQDTVTIWYDMSSKACLNADALFIEPNSTHEERVKLFARNMGTKIDDNFRIIPNEHVFQLGYKDLSGNGYDLRIGSESTSMHPLTRTVLPYFGDDEWYFNAGGQGSGERLEDEQGMKESFVNGQLPSASDLYNTSYVYAAETGCDRWIHLDDTGTSNTESGTRTSEPYNSKIDSNGLINGRPDRAMFARINHYQNVTDSQSPNHKRKPLKHWEICIGQRNTFSHLYYGSDYENAPDLKPGMIVDTPDGDFEIGPPLVLSMCDQDRDPNGNSISGYTYGQVAGNTWHAIKPAKHNTSFPQPKWGVNEFTKAKMPLRPNPDFDYYADSTYILRDLTFRKNEDTSFVKVTGPGAYNNSSLDPQLNLVSVDDVNDPLARIFYVRHTTSETRIYFHKLLLPEISQIKDNPSDWSETELFVYDEFGQLYFWGKTGDNSESQNSTIMWSTIVGDYGNYIEFEFQPEDILYSPTLATTGDFGGVKAEYTAVTTSALSQENSGSLVGFDSTGRKFNIVIVRKSSSETKSAFPPVEYDKKGLQTPGYLPVRGGSQFGVMESTLQLTSNSLKNLLTFAIWFKFPGIKNPSDNSQSVQPIIPLIDLGGRARLSIVGDQTTNNAADPARNFNANTTAGVGKKYIRFEGVHDPAPATGQLDFLHMDVFQSEHIPQLTAQNTWHHVAVVFDTSQNFVKMYYNGKEVATLASDSTEWGAIWDRYELDTNRITKAPSTLTPLGHYIAGGDYRTNYIGNVASTANDHPYSGAQSLFYTFYGSTHLTECYLDVGCLQIWDSTALTSSEIYELFDGLSGRFGVNEYTQNSDDFIAPPNDRDYSQDMRHIPKKLDVNLNTFTAQTSPSTVVAAIEDMSLDTVGFRLPKLDVFAILDQDHIAQNLPVDTSSYTDATSASVKNDVGFYTHLANVRWNTSGHTNKHWIGSGFWNDSELIEPGEPSINGGVPFVGMAAFDDDKYLGSTYMFLHSKPSLPRRNKFPIGQNGAYISTTPYNTTWKPTNSFHSNWKLSDIFNGNYTKLTTFLSDANRQFNSHFWDGYTHDVSGFYQVNGEPSSVDNPYVTKTTSTGTPSNQGWIYTSGSGHASSNFYDASSMTLSDRVGVWGWKPNEIVYGFKTTPISDIWGIGAFNGSEPNDGRGYWGPNKTYTPQDNVKYYCFVGRGSK